MTSRELQQSESSTISDPLSNINNFTPTDTDNEEEETDEFVVIKEPRDGAQSVDGGVDNENDGQRIVYVDKSHTVSECGSTVADVGEGLDCGKSVCSSSTAKSSSPPMNSSAISNKSQNFLDSMYLSLYGSQYADANQMEAKLAEIVRAEQEKSRATLEQIMRMVTELSKEKSDNSELRDKLNSYIAQVEKTEQRTKELQDTIVELKSKINKDAEEQARLINKLDNMRATVANKDSDIEDLENMLKDTCLENAQLKQALQQVQNEVKQKSNDTENQKEIINVLQEEVTESNKALADTRKRYQERLNVLEEVVASYHQRNENNSEKRKKACPSRTPSTLSSSYPSPFFIQNANQNLDKQKKQLIFICNQCLCGFPSNGLLQTHLSSGC